MVNVAVLLNGGIIHDSRVIKVIRTLSAIKNVHVDLFYIHKTEKDKNLFSENVKLFGIDRNENFKVKLVRHTFFYNEFLFFVEHVLKTKIEYNFIYANDLLCLKPAILLKEKLKCKVIYDSHEIFIETLNQFFPQAPNLFKRIIFTGLLKFMKNRGTNIEADLVKKVDYFITVSHGLKKYFEDKYKVSEIRVLMNWPLKSINTEVINLHSELNIKAGDFIVLYQGILNQGRGLTKMVKAMKHTLPQIRLVFLGSGTMKNSLKELVVKEELKEKIYFMDNVEQNKLVNYTKGADCGILIIEPINLSKKYAAPNKLFEYINAGIPSIVSFMHEADIVFEKYLIGIRTENSPEKIAEAMNYMFGMNREDFKKECIKAAQEYNWENQEAILSDIVFENGK